jgi:aryl-alcohol dehydrogenase-like predicted oxidoreductase
MEKIALGKQGLKVSQLGFGCMGLTTAYGSRMPDDAIVALLESVYQHGVNFWDTANLYCFPDFKRLLWLSSPIVCQEEIISRAVENVGRDNLVLATKTGVKLSVFPKLSTSACGEPAFIREQCEASLKRLGMDCLDLFYLHRIDQTIPIEISMMEMKKLVQEGKVKYIGLSECSAATIRRAHKVHPLTVVQLEYSLWCRGIEKEIIPTLKELGIGLVAYSPLGRGFFGGAHKQPLDKGDFRHSQDRFKEEANLKMYDDLEEFAKGKGVSTPQLALAWVQAQQVRLGGAGVVAIPGTTKESNLVNNVESLKLKLIKADLDKIETIVPWEQVKGSRYGAGHDCRTWESDNNPELSAEQRKELGM